MKNHPYLETTTKFRQIVDKIYVDGDKSLRSEDLYFNISWYPVYRTLASVPDQFSVNDLAAKTGYTHIAVKNVLNALKSKGLLNQEVDPEDRRSKLNSLTVSGRKLFDKTSPIWDRLEESLEAVFAPINPNLVYDIEFLKEVFRKQGLYQVFTNPPMEKFNIYNLTESDSKKAFDFLNIGIRAELDRILSFEEKEVLTKPFQTIYPKGGVYLVLKHKREIVGTVILIPSDKDTIEICFWYVSPSHRKKNLGTQLLKRAFAYARQNHKKNIIISIPQTKTQAMELAIRNTFFEPKESFTPYFQQKKHTVLLKYL